MDTKTSLEAAATLASMAGAASAHPGHAEASAMGLWEALVHLLTQPDHLALLVGAAVAVGLLIRQRRRSRR